MNLPLPSPTIDSYITEEVLQPLMARIAKGNNARRGSCTNREGCSQKFRSFAWLTAVVGKVYLDDALGGGDSNIRGMSVLREGLVVHLGPARKTNGKNKKKTSKH